MKDELFWELAHLSILDLGNKDLQKIGDRDRYKELLVDLKLAAPNTYSQDLKEKASELNFRSSRAKILSGLQRWFQYELSQRTSQSKMACKSTLSDEYYITETALKKFNIKPHVYTKNPYYSRAPEMALYSRFQVEYLLRINPELKAATQKLRERRDKAAVKAEAEAKKREELLNEWENNTEALFEEFSQNYSSKNIALAYLIKYLNKYVKCYKKYFQCKQSQKNAIDLIYKIKDKWILTNKENVTHAVCSKRDRRTYIDWDALHYDKQYIDDWLEPEEYEVEEVFELFAFTFDIDGEEIRFHSTKNITEKDLPLVPHDASATPLTKEERKALPVLKVLAMAAINLDFPTNIIRSFSEV